MKAVVMTFTTDSFHCEDASCGCGQGSRFVQRFSDVRTATMLRAWRQHSDLNYYSNYWWGLLDEKPNPRHQKQVQELAAKHGPTPYPWETGGVFHGWHQSASNYTKQRDLARRALTA